MTPPEALRLPDLAATAAMAARLAPLLRMGDVVALRGGLGAGKTAFARALLRALGVAGDVPSPTFTLLQGYETPRFPVCHFDLYRLKDGSELEETGWDDALADGVVLVEWPERAEGFMPRDRLDLAFGVEADGTRRVAVSPFGAWEARLKDVAS
jgi:tRNA threonylcarbamoyladenosine biosynthesis protein TsaE